MSHPCSTVVLPGLLGTLYFRKDSTSTNSSAIHNFSDNELRRREGDYDDFSLGNEAGFTA